MTDAPSNSQGHVTPEAALERFVDAFNAADQRLGYSIELIRLVDGVETRRLTVRREQFDYTDDESNGYDALQACHDHLARVRREMRLEAMREVLASLALDGSSQQGKAND